MTPPADEVAAGISDRRPVRRVALASLVAALALVALKLATALATGSLAMLSETAHSGLDAMVTALTLLELFIAGLQAFIFTFLTAVFIGLAKHPPH